VAIGSSFQALAEDLGTWVKTSNSLIQIAIDIVIMLNFVAVQYAVAKGFRVVAIGSVLVLFYLNVS
jgi:hypothetical protein